MERFNNVCYIFDENFLAQGMTAIKSLIVNNPDINIDIYCLVMNFRKALYGKLEGLATDKINITIINIDSYADKLSAMNTMGWSLTAYLRLFIDSILPNYVERVLYIDSDTVVCETLKPLLSYDLEGKTVGVVLDKYIPKRTRKKFLKNKQGFYFNSGVMLIDLVRWKEKNIGDLCVEYLNNHPEAHTMPDQNALNYVLDDDKVLVPLQYNVDGYGIMLPYNLGKKIMRQKIEPIFTEDDYENARKCPVIVHFIGFYLDKPWIKDNIQPYAMRYVEYARAAGVEIKYTEPRKYSRDLGGMIRAWTKKNVRQALLHQNYRRAVSVYNFSDFVLTIGSCFKKIVKR